MCLFLLYKLPTKFLWFFLHTVLVIHQMYSHWNRPNTVNRKFLFYPLWFSIFTVLCCRNSDKKIWKSSQALQSVDYNPLVFLCRNQNKAESVFLTWGILSTGFVHPLTKGLYFFENPVPDLLISMCGYGSPMFSPKCFGEDGNFITQAKGTGPFELREEKDEQYVTAERFNDYWGEKAKNKIYKV